jgi:hypothetical protein
MTDNEIRKILIERTPLDKMIEKHSFGDYTDIVGSAGSDTLTYRIYSNGQVVEK